MNKWILVSLSYSMVLRLFTNWVCCAPVLVAMDWKGLICMPLNMDAVSPKIVSVAVVISTDSAPLRRLSVIKSGRGRLRRAPVGHGLHQDVDLGAELIFVRSGDYAPALGRHRDPSESLVVGFTYGHERLSTLQD
ncbi:hypothetical protein diail_11603, partial [Diaporthe ilicicola]